MKKSLFLAALAVLFAGHSASAQLVVPAGTRPVGYCAIQARLTISSGALGIAVSSGQGFGRVVCDYRDGTQEIMPILIETSAIGVGVQLPETVSAKLFAPGFGVTDAGAVGLLGTYGVIRATGGVGYANGEIGLGLTVNETGVTIPAILQLDAAFHFLAATLNVGEMTLHFDPRNLQARYVQQLPIQHPHSAHHHGHAAAERQHQHQQQQHRLEQSDNGQSVPLPPKRPADLGNRPNEKKPAAPPAPPAPGVNAKPPATAPAGAAPAPSAPGKAAPADSAEPVTREI